jgi:hypothetical protein
MLKKKIELSFGVAKERLDMELFKLYLAKRNGSFLRIARERLRLDDDQKGR